MTEGMETKPEGRKGKRKGGGGGWVFPAVILLVLAGWCVKDGWFKPGYEHARSNQVLALVLGVAGVGLLVYEGLRPRTERVEATQPAEKGLPSEVLADLPSLLEKLTALRTCGALSKEEFERAKGMLLGKPLSKAEESMAMIENLHGLYKRGALSEGEFNIKKWDILSK